MRGAFITSRVQLASLDLTDGVENMSDTHPSLVEKPVLSVADLHLIGKFFYAKTDLTCAEATHLEDLADVFDDYLTDAVGADWDSIEALVA